MTAPAAYRTAVPARLVIASIAGLWLAYFILATARGMLFGLGFHDALIWRRLVVVLASMAVTAVLWPMLRLLDPRALWIKALAVMLVALPASLLLAEINQRVFADIESKVVENIGEQEGLRIRRDEAGNLLVDVAETPVEGEELQQNPPPVTEQTSITIAPSEGIETHWRQLTDIALGRYFLLLAWAALYFALVNAEQARAAERRAGEYQRAAKSAELRSLRYQVNPHFLFNTLNSLSALVLTGKRAEAEAVIQTLSGFYRRSLASDPTSDVALEQEIALQRMYLELEAVRFPDRLVVEFDIPPALANCSVPGMILQPLIENSVKYAVAPSVEPVRITVSARSAAGQLVIEVRDNGTGGASEAGFGIGLANVRDRLAARHGAAAAFESARVPEGGWRSVIGMPLIDHD